MDSLFDRATGALAGNFATATMWSPADWDDALRYGETARQRAGKGEDWKRRWVIDAGERAAGMLREARGVRASVAVAAALYERGTLDGEEAVMIMESA